MPDKPIPPPDATTLDNFLRAEALKLRAQDKPPTTLKQWAQRRANLGKRMRAAMGPVPDKDCPLEPRVLGTLKRDDYRIEKVIFQSRPDVWVTASAYVPTKVKGKVPAVLVVHGHWRGARRDPVVQARCLGLVKLGFFVLAVDAFGSGERYTAPAPGTYHGALYGATLWPTGHTLLGMQVYDNRRAVDYLGTRSEVDATKLGVTGASGGGNQSMYAGALDDRIGAVVPVCSVGTYQSYLHAACCVCEVLPGALSFTEEGEVLGLVAPRALMVINATKDGFQFSVGEAKKSLAMASAIFKVAGVHDKVKHLTFESPHAYNKEMREAMYGWMTLWLKGEGKGEPIPEPAHQIETAEELACFPDPREGKPRGFLLLPEFAGRVGRDLVQKHDVRPKHVEDWEARAMLMKASLRKQVFGDFPKTQAFVNHQHVSSSGGTARAVSLLLAEDGVALRLTRDSPLIPKGKKAEAVLVLNFDDVKQEAASKSRDVFLSNRDVLTLELRGTGTAQPAGDVIVGAPDHTSSEHALWVGRPLLGQWVWDVRSLLEATEAKDVVIVGLGQASIVALCAAALSEDRIKSVVVSDVPVSYVTDQPYAVGTRMGLLAPGILKVGDIAHLAALLCPRRLQIIGGKRLTGEKLKEKELKEAFAFTRDVFDVHKAGKNLVVAESATPEDIIKQL